ncbi:hypothetical protein CARUB_v10003191mg [Capsella rubella]|uniref:Uncharacterized protein n=1 Tax=Capsella rubella TaxID=81985 RepID=R0FJF2_9BRAS|nr:uncharacterized protein LOC17883524 [Capsella rubella]EOA22537.1 hypothetical protein CARUB_v10003191mg [Capsella rubella]
MVRTVTPEVPPTIKPEARTVAVIPAGTRIGLNRRNSGMEAATAVPTRDRPASNKRNTAAVVAKKAVIRPLSVGLLVRTITFSRFFFRNNIFNGQRKIIILVLSDGCGIS